MSTVKFEREGDVGSIVLANPPANELSRQFADDLIVAVHAASASSIRVLVIRAEGPNFGTGGDVPEWVGKDDNWFRTFIAEVNGAYAAIESLRLPVICVVRGAVVSGHFELALRADLIIASDNATFTWVESGTGFTPLAGGLQRLAELVGRGRAAHHVMMAETVDAAEAERIGIVYRVVPDDELDAAATDVAENLARGATRGYAADRALLKAWSSGGVAGADQLMLDLSMDLYASVDVQNAIAQIAQAAQNGEDYVPPPFVGR